MDENTSTDISTLNEEIIKINEFENELNYKNEIKNLDELNSKELDYPRIKLSKTRFYIVIFGIVLSLIMSSLDISIITTALPTISTHFNSREDYSWVVAAYILGNISFQPMFGKSADIFGRRPVMIFVLVLLVITSTLCGVSQDIKMLILTRGFQGISSGGTLVMANIIISDIVPMKSINIYMSISGVIFAFSSVFGPLIGGLLTDHLSWRWIFYINIPIGLIAIIIVLIFVNIPVPPGLLSERIKKIDFLGTFLFVVSVVMLLLGLSWGGTKYSWSSAIIILLFIGFIISGILYFYVEWKIAIEPLIPFQIFKNRNIGLSCIASFFLGLAYIGFTNTIPLLYQDGRGINATYSALRLIPQSIFSSLGSIIYLIGKFGYIEKYLKCGSILFIVSSYLVSLFGFNSSYLFEFFVLFLFGFGYGLIMQNLDHVTQQSSDKRFTDIGITFINFFRLIGSVFGITIVSAVISNRFQAYFDDKYPGAKVSINDIHSIEDGENTFVDAIQTSFKIVLIPSAVMILVFTLFYTGIISIGNRKKEKTVIEEDQLKKEVDTELSYITEVPSTISNNIEISGITDEPSTENNNIELSEITEIPSIDNSNNVELSDITDVSSIIIKNI